MLIVGYVATVQIDQGDAWVNSVDPKVIVVTAHKECAWNDDLLRPDSDVVDLKPIKPEEAAGLICGYCCKPLTEKAYFAFQAVPMGTSKREPKRFRTQAHYDTWEGYVDGWLVIDTQTNEKRGLYPRNRACYLARKWNKQEETAK